MCWRDDIVEERYCSECGQIYCGDLGHRDCSARQIKPATPIIWEDPKISWICDACKNKPDIKTHSCEVDRNYAPGQRGRFCECECNAPCGGLAMPNSEFVELFYNGKTYLVRKSDVDNKLNKIVVLPDRTTLDLTQMYVDTTDKHGNKLERPCFRGSSPGYEIWGQLPVVGVIRAKALFEYKQELPRDINPNENICCDTGEESK